MLHLTVAAREMWDEGKQEFIYVKEQKLQLEHSLVSLAKWESKWCIPFLGPEPKTPEQTIDYIRCMTLTQNVDSLVYGNLSVQNIKDVNAYIDAPMTATTINEDKTASKNHEIVTAEIIYWWMIALNIPFECQKWHLNRLLMLIRVCNEKNKPQKKRSRREVQNRNAAINAARRAKYNTRG